METVDTAECPHCGAPVKPTATFCLACDTPITDTERGLSVAAPVAAPARPRPFLVSAVIIGILAVLGGSTYGVVHYMHSRHQKAEDQASSNVRRAVTLLVRAESGETGACRRVTPIIYGTDRRKNCLAIVGHDPGAHLENITMGTPHLGPTIGKIRMTATVVDDQSSHKLDQNFTITDITKDWELQWDGAPPA